MEELVAEQSQRLLLAAVIAVVIFTSCVRRRGSLSPHPTLLASALLALVRADARTPTLLAFALYARVRADARVSTLLALAPLALVRALRGLFLASTFARLRRHPSPASRMLRCHPAALRRLGGRGSLSSPPGPGAELISERPRRAHLSVGAPDMLLSAALVTSPPLRLQCLHARVSVSRRRERVVEYCSCYNTVE